MKKFLAGLLLGVFVTVSLVGCGKDEKEDSMGTPSTETVSENPSGDGNAGGDNANDGSDYIGMTYKEFDETGAKVIESMPYI